MAQYDDVILPARYDAHDNEAQEVKMYMEGIGVKERTRHLTDSVWNTVLFGIFGLWIAICGPFLSWGLLIHKFPWQSPPTAFDLSMAAAIAVLAVLVGIRMFSHYFRAMRALRKHTLIIESETKQRGRGWARS